MLTVLIVDDQELIRLGVRSLLDANSSLELTSHLAGSGEEALVLYKAISPDIIFLDINMPGMGALKPLEEYYNLIPKQRSLFYLSWMMVRYLSNWFIWVFQDLFVKIRVLSG